MQELTVTNSSELLDLLNKMLPTVRTNAVMDGLQAGANMINSQARSNLNASKRGASKTGYSYYATAFKMENLKSKTPEEIGVRTGVYDKWHGYKLRWMQWGTGERKTFLRKSAITKKTIAPMNRGRIIGNNFFFGAVRGQQDEIFKVVSDAVLKSLENLTKN